MDEKRTSQQRVSQQDVCRLICERIVNEGWSEAERHRDEISTIVERGSVESERDRSLLLIAATAFLQKSTLGDLDLQDIGLDEFSRV